MHMWSDAVICMIHSRYRDINLGILTLLHW